MSKYSTSSMLAQLQKLNFSSQPQSVQEDEKQPPQLKPSSDRDWRSVLELSLKAGNTVKNKRTF